MDGELSQVLGVAGREPDVAQRGEVVVGQVGVGDPAAFGLRVAGEQRLPGQQVDREVDEQCVNLALVLVIVFLDRL